MLISAAYEDFFEKLFCASNETIKEYLHLFDLRDPRIKRKEFQKDYKRILSILLKRDKGNCMLRFPGICKIRQGINIDHLVPLSTNVLNKLLKDAVAPVGKKIPSESFGSNHIDNLVITCASCNAHKKHRFLSRDEYRRIFEERKANPQNRI